MQVYLIKILKFLFRLRYKKLNAGFWSNSKDLDDISKKNLLIDLSNEKVNHFGDQLFFISAFANADCQNIKFIVNEKYYMLWKNFGIKNVYKQSEKIRYNGQIYISTFENALLNNTISREFKKRVYFDFTDQSINQPLYLHLKEFFKLKYNLREKNNIIKNDSKLTKKPFYLFNDIIYSRRFLRKSLSVKLKNYIDNNIGYNSPIYFIGSKSDKNFYNFNSKLIDLRGRISFEEMIQLFNHENCKGYIGLDNGLMHLGLLYYLNCKILFRGKIFKSQTNHHYKSINIAVNKEAKNNIEYIDVK